MDVRDVSIDGLDEVREYLQHFGAFLTQFSVNPLTGY
jgi:hypothetical protein